MDPTPLVDCQLRRHWSAWIVSEPISIVKTFSSKKWEIGFLLNIANFYQKSKRFFVVSTVFALSEGSRGELKKHSVMMEFDLGYFLGWYPEYWWHL